MIDLLVTLVGYVALFVAVRLIVGFSGIDPEQVGRSLRSEVSL